MNRRIRVVRLTISGGTGGIGTRFLTQARLLDHDRHELHVVYLSEGLKAAQSLRDMGITVHELHCDVNDLKLLSLGAIKKLYTLVRIIQPDIIHSSIGTANFVNALTALLSTQTKMRRGHAVIGEEVCVPDRKLSSRIKFSVGYLLSDAVISASKATAHYLEKKEWVSPEKIRIIPSCYSINFNETPHKQQRNKSTPFRFIMVSRISAEKNHPFTLHAFSSLCQSLPAPLPELHIVGGDEKGLAPLRELATSLGIEQQVRFLGFRTDVAELLATANCFLLPSTTEGSSMALIEALRSGLPVIASDAGGTPEVMEGYPDGWLLPVSDKARWVEAMARIVQLSPEERELLGNTARELAIRRFSPHRYVRDLEDLYSSLMSSRS